MISLPKRPRSLNIMSFLCGSAIDWFTPNILNHDPAHPPIWMTSSLALNQQLYLHFGPRDSAQVAAIKLDQLQMQNNQWVSKYSMQLWPKHLSAMLCCCTGSIRVLLLDLKMCFLTMIIILLCNSVSKSPIAYWEKQERQEHDQKPSSSGKASSGKGSDNRQTGQTTTSASNTQPRSQQSN